ncbi:hypothetical protein CKF54_01475 [Psittacicella hinzii]|uniref:Thiol:disulfide interchange protein n=1 Tax=Psittacicella hinzii TaxID=2028575 RepID=A0A3A1Y778_9GAMM|nr:thioredoxin domain-containing protein [Psittacicella hinzii]RIY34133.1 hypothetical protein CKF54_01475 [Psittacicella hinzii]
MNLQLIKKSLFTFSAASLALFFSNLSSANVVAGKDYTALNQPQTPNPTVYMAMSLSCTHCADFTKVYEVPEKIKEMLKQTYPDNGEFLEFHIVMSNTPIYNDFARLRSVLYVTKRDDLLSSAFDLPYKYKGSDQVLKDWVSTNLKLNKADTDALWNSSAVNTFYNKQEELTKQYDIRQTPTFIINGKYELNLSSIAIPYQNPTPSQIGDAVVNQIKEILLKTTK